MGSSVGFGLKTDRDGSRKSSSNVPARRWPNVLRSDIQARLDKIVEDAIGDGWDLEKLSQELKNKQAQVANEAYKLKLKEWHKKQMGGH